MTEKIFHQDALLKTAVVKVTAAGTDETGHYALLDRSIFYPEGGGQPADSGVIGDTKVTDVQTIDGEVRHYTARLIDTGEYNTAIDWQRRFDHMQQHTGQHLLSAVFEDDLGMATKSFHLGMERVSIDIESPHITSEQLMSVERGVNVLISSYIPIETEWVTQEQASRLELRKKPAVKGEIRLVKIGDLDINACGGTHLGNTAEIGVIKIIRTEKTKGATRVYFLCGNRAMEHFRLLQSVTDELTKSLNVPVHELADAAAAVLNDRREKEKRLKKLSLQLLEAEAEGLRPEGNTLVKDFSGREFKEVQQLAKAVAKKHSALYLLFTVKEGSNLRFVCARGMKAEGDMTVVLEKLVRHQGGNFGGTEDFAQGGNILGGSPETYTLAFLDIIKEIT